MYSEELLSYQNCSSPMFSFSETNEQNYISHEEYSLKNQQKQNEDQFDVESLPNCFESIFINNQSFYLEQQDLKAQQYEENQEKLKKILFPKRINDKKIQKTEKISLKKNDSKQKQNISFESNYMKNFCTAFFQYIKKNETATNRVLDHLSIDQKHFNRKYMVKKSQNLITSIAKFESLFMINQKNKIGNSIQQEKKALRILALRFIRNDQFTYCFSQKQSKKFNDKQINVSKLKSNEQFFQNRFKYLQILEKIVKKQQE